jgi:hypothetical protein
MRVSDPSEVVSPPLPQAPAYSSPALSGFVEPPCVQKSPHPCGGILVDVVGIGYDDYTAEQRDKVLAAFPRGQNFKNDFMQVQACSALKKPLTTYGTVNFDYILEHAPATPRPNACARIRSAPWPT